MNASVTAIRTEAETAFLEMFEARRASLPGAPDARKTAIERFARTGLPHRRVESWHYTDLRAAMRVASPLRAVTAEATPVLPRDDFTQGPRLVVLDGDFRPELSDLHSLPAGVTVQSMADAWRAGESIASLPATFEGKDDAVVALNTALAGDGVLIDVAAGTQAAATPLVLLIAVSGRQAQSAFSRSVLRVGAGATVTLVEDNRVLHEAATQTNDVLIVTLAENAQAAHIARVEHPGEASMHLHSLVLTQGAHSNFKSFCLIADGGLVRRQIFAGVNGQHADLKLSGLALLDGSRLADMTLVVDHTVPHGTSREFFRYILEHESTGVYQGKVIVRPHAQKTDGGMKSSALMLTEGATMNNKPELEIFADDVVCGHGATVGQLDEDQLFYLMSRGVPRHEAEALLIEAFGVEAIERITDERLREALLENLRDWLLRRASVEHRKARVS